MCSIVTQCDRFWSFWRAWTAGLGSACCRCIAIWKGALLRPEHNFCFQQRFSFHNWPCHACCLNRSCPSLWRSALCPAHTSTFRSSCAGQHSECCSPTWLRGLRAERWQHCSACCISLWRVWGALWLWAEPVADGALSGLQRLRPGTRHNSRIWHPRYTR